MKSKKITAWRREIDAVDRELKRLLLKRMKLSRRVIAAKLALGLPKRDPRREGEIIERLVKRLGADEAKLVKAVYGEIFRQAVGTHREALRKAYHQASKATRKTLTDGEGLS